MKRLIFICLAFLVVAAIITPAAFAQGKAGEIQVQVDGLPVAFDVPPLIQNGRTLVPFRAIAEALNVNVSWDGVNRTISASDGKNSVWLQIGNPTASRNQIPMELDAPPLMLDNRTLIPLRFFSEAFNCRVNWDGAANMVKISSPPKSMTVIGFYALGDSKSSSWQDLFGMPYPQTARANTDLVSKLALGWYSLDVDGNLLTRSSTGWQRPDGWEKVLEAANTYRLDTEMVVHLTNRDGVISKLLSNEAAVSRAVSSIVAEARQYGGVNLDLEGLGWQLKGEQLKAVQDSFTRFVSLLAKQLRAANLNLTLTLHAPNSAYKGYDYQALGQLADQIIIMAYDYGSRPEPVTKVTEAVTMAREVVPPEKLILGISTPSETADSILTKVGIAKRYKLAGIALWRLGLVKNEMWRNLRTTIQPR
ncbi:MAG: copper amine oxidase [Clostridia bacterium]|nr:copper amine oxidase [Clostridia bacterium]